MNLEKRSHHNFSVFKDSTKGLIARQLLGTQTRKILSSLVQSLLKVYFKKSHYFSLYELVFEVCSWILIHLMDLFLLIIFLLSVCFIYLQMNPCRNYLKEEKVMCFKGCCPGFHQITTSYSLLEHWPLQILPEMVRILFHFSSNVLF